MDISIDEARQLGIDVMAKCGLPADHARIVADHLVEAMMVGRAFAGLPRALALAETLKKKGPGGPITTVREDATTALIDGGDTNGYVTSLIGMDKAIALAKASGVGVVAVRNTWYSGRLAYYVERAARQDLIAFHTVNTTARVAPLGGIDRIFGTNPLAFAFPSEREPVVVDFGTSATTWGEVLLRKHTGTPLEEGWAVDEAGAPTLDAASALAGAILPWGEHRGFGLMLVAQIFGILSGSKVVVDDVGDFGFFFLAIDPGRFMDVAEFKRRVGDLAGTVTGSRPAPGGAPIRVPGQGSHAKREAARARGTVPIDEAVYHNILAELGRDSQDTRAGQT
ncbi:MAG: Ureidoglycolate dehydrogenase [Enterovirga sp.]|nr:Ureidoglycolate dehydrogenase [Enterovirga sp.]